MSWYKYLILLYVFLTLIPAVNATDSVTYTCCKNFTTNWGTLVEDFEDSTQWILNNGGAVWETDTVHVKNGLASLKMSSTGNAGATALGILNYSTFPSAVNNWHMWVYVENSSNVSSIYLYFYNLTTSTTKYNGFVIDATQNLVTGWNDVRLDTYDGTLNGGQNYTDVIKRVQFRVNNAGGTLIANVSFDDMRSNVVERPKTVLTFDDTFLTQYSDAYPIMASNSQRGVMFPIANRIDSDNTKYMTTSQLKSLNTAGWDISAHTLNHADLTTLSETQIDAQLIGSQNWMANNFSRKGSYFFAYPIGNYNDTVLTHVKALFNLSRTTILGNYQGEYNSSDGENISYLVKSFAVGKTTTNQTVKNYVNSTINHSGVLVLTFHNITATWGSTTNDFSLSNFTEVSNYIASRSSDIDVITFYDYMNINIPNNTPIFGKTINIKSSGIATMAVNNYLDDTTINMFVSPSSDSVNVTVSTWNTNGDYYKAWSEESTTHSVTTSHTVGDLPSNYPVKIKVDGIVKATGVTNSTGYITFTYASGFSSHNFEIGLSTQEEIALQTGWCGSGNSTMNGAFLIGTVLAFVVGGALLLVVLNGFDVKFVVGGVAIILGTIVTMVIGNIVYSRMLVCG